MTYRLPSLKALRAFEAAARHLSFKHAAAELCVTPGAISQQVKALESSMGVMLFRRLPQGLALTSEGEAYLPAISDAFRQVSRATDVVSTTLKARVFRLGVAPGLGDALRSRIAGLQDPKTNGPVVQVNDAAETEALTTGRIDALMRPPLPRHPGLHLDQITLAEGDVTLALLPGTAGCREHLLLLDALRGA